MRTERNTPEVIRSMNQNAFLPAPAQGLADRFHPRIAGVFLHTAQGPDRVESQGTAGGGRSRGALSFSDGDEMPPEFVLPGNSTNYVGRVLQLFQEFSG